MSGLHEHAVLVIGVSTRKVRVTLSFSALHPPYLEIVCEYLLKERVSGIALCCKYRVVDYLLSKMHMTLDFSVYLGPVLSLCQGEAKAVAP